MKLSRNFWEYELACKGTGCCGGSCPVDDGLVRALEHFRELMGHGFTPSSGFRCLRHNRAIGSRDTSKHPRGRAADISVRSFPGGRVEDMLEAAREIPEVRGLGAYSWGIHIDVRRGVDARVEWDFR